MSYMQTTSGNSAWQLHLQFAPAVHIFAGCFRANGAAKNGMWDGTGMWLLLFLFSVSRNGRSMPKAFAALLTLPSLAWLMPDDLFVERMCSARMVACCGFLRLWPLAKVSRMPWSNC